MKLARRGPEWRGVGGAQAMMAVRGPCSPPGCEGNVSEADEACEDDSEGATDRSPDVDESDASEVEVCEQRRASDEPGNPSADRCVAAMAQVSFPRGLALSPCGALLYVAAYRGVVVIEL